MRSAKTEVQYFDAIRREKRASATDIVITHPGATAPIQIVDHAEQRFLAHPTYDAVYAVFDRDSHPSYAQALHRAGQLNGTLKNRDDANVPFLAIPSVPNFELWLLLHFRDVHEFMTRQDVYAAIRQANAYPAYTKNRATVYEETKARLADASRRATYLRGRYTAAPGNEPYTDADALTARLTAMAARLAH